jgi:hypothetical protein
MLKELDSQLEQQIAGGREGTAGDWASVIEFPGSRKPTKRAERAGLGRASPGIVERKRGAG